MLPFLHVPVWMDCGGALVKDWGVLKFLFFFETLWASVQKAMKSPLFSKKLKGGPLLSFLTSKFFFLLQKFCSAVTCWQTSQRQVDGLKGMIWGMVPGLEGQIRHVCWEQNKVPCSFLSLWACVCRRLAPGWDCLLWLKGRAAFSYLLHRCLHPVLLSGSRQ